jgi:glycosyltransferase involved in cell wall biosynthesis
MKAGNKKVVYVLSHVFKSLVFEWTLVGLKNSVDLTVILLNPEDSPFENFLRQENIRVVRFRYRNKADLPLTFFRLSWFFLTRRPDVVHAHLFEATLAGLTAAWITRIRTRLYTRHNSTFHHLYFPGAVKYDRWSNALATGIVSISQATDDTLVRLEQVSVRKIHKIPSGFDFTVFTDVSKERVQRVRERWGVPEGRPCIGIISRHIEWKGLQYSIPAFAGFLRAHPEATLVLANASGPYHQTVMDLLKNIPSQHVVLIPFEEDIAALYPLFNLYIHVPIDPTCEAFGQTYVEAMAAGIPSVVTLSGIAAEYVEHRQNAWVVPFKDSAAIGEGLETLWHDEELRHTLVENGRQAVLSHYGLVPMLALLNELYDR